MKHKYRCTQIEGNPDTNKIICIDETLLLHDDDNEQLWLIGVIESRSKKIGLDFIKDRDEETIKNFINNHIEPGSHIVTDGWFGYRFLDGYESV